jgi:hypothetical protein
VDDSATFKPVPARLPGAAHGNTVLPSTISLKWVSTIAEICSVAIERLVRIPAFLHDFILERFNRDALA